MVRAPLVERIRAALRHARRRLPWLDQVIRAGVRYDRADGGRLAAAVTYYAFFASFSLALLAFAVLGYVLDKPAALNSVQSYLSANLPRLDTQALRNARGTAGLLGFTILPISGLWWVDSLRSSIRAIWQLPQYPGSYLRRRLIDLAVLTGLGLLLFASLATTAATKAGLRWLLASGQVPAGGTLLDAAGATLGIAVNTLLAVAVLTGLPSLRIRPRVVLPPALLVAVGLEILKTLGEIYVQRTQANPAYQVVAGAVGLLIFLNVLSQLILFAAALTAAGTLEPTNDQPPPAPPAAATPAHITSATGPQRTSKVSAPRPPTPLTEPVDPSR
jgi:membrane protein